MKVQEMASHDIRTPSTSCINRQIGISIHSPQYAQQQLQLAKMESYERKMDVEERRVITLKEEARAYKQEGCGVRGAGGGGVALRP